jgi:hypothetical protein
MLDLSGIVDITVNSPAAETTSRSFSLGLFLSENSVISTATRVKKYSSVDEMIADGFTSDSAEVTAATLYFGQSVSPKYVLIGTRAPATSATVTTQTSGSTTLVVNSTAALSIGRTVTGTGIASGTTISAIVDGTTLTLSAAATADASSGTVAIGAESAVAALSACRTANSEWYMVCPLDAASADILLMAAYIESAKPASAMFATTADTDVPVNSDGNICAQLKAAGYSRTLIQYSTQDNAAAAIMGYTCGANDGTTAYTLMFKSETGVTAESLTTTEISNLKELNCNFLVTRSESYTFFQYGVMASGQFFDEINGIDMLTADIQTNVINLQVSETKIPQTDDGIALIVSVIEQACADAVTREFLAPGEWTGKTISVGESTLTSGDTLSTGYKVMVDSVNNQSTANREARIAPPVYVCVKEAGAVHSVSIVVNVNR